MTVSAATLQLRSTTTARLETIGKFQKSEPPTNVTTSPKDDNPC